MKKCVLVAFSLGVFGLLGCGRVPPAAIKAVAGAGQGAKVAPKAAGRVAGRVAPADAARPAREGDPWKELLEVMKEGVEWMQPGGDDRKRR